MTLRELRVIDFQSGSLVIELRLRKLKNNGKEIRECIIEDYDTTDTGHFTWICLVQNTRMKLNEPPGPYSITRIILLPRGRSVIPKESPEIQNATTIQESLGVQFI